LNLADEDRRHAKWERLAKEKKEKEEEDVDNT